MKRLILPAGILIIILAVWFIQSKIETRRTSAKTIEGFLKLNAKEVNKVSVKTAGDSLNFILRDGRWYLDGDKPRLADSSAVNTMVNSSAGIKVGNVISENPERQRDFLVDTINGNFIQFFNGDRLLNSIIIGKMSNDYAHTYVRKPGDKEVYLSEGLLTYLFNRRRTQWLNRTILAFQPDNAKEIEFVYPNKVFHLRRGVSEWYVSKSPYTDSLPTDSMKTEGFIRQAGMLRASDFASEIDSGSTAFNKLALAMKVSLLSGPALTVEFAAADSTAKRLFCRVPESEDIFVVSRSIYDNMMKQFADFLPDK